MAAGLLAKPEVLASLPGRDILGVDMLEIPASGFASAFEMEVLEDENSRSLYTISSCILYASL